MRLYVYKYRSYCFHYNNKSDGAETQLILDQCLSENNLMRIRHI